MRILIVSPSFLPAYKYGGPPRAIHALARALVEAGHGVLVLTSNENVDEDLDVPTGLDTVFDGVPVRYLRRAHRGSYHFVPGLVPALRHEASKFDVALVRGHWNFFNVAASLVLPQQKLAYILSPEGMLHGYARSLKRTKKWIYWRLVERRNYQRAAGIIALSQREAREVRAMGCSQPLAIIPNSVVGPAGMELRAVDVRERTSQRILHVGRIHRIKGLENLIAAFALVHRRFCKAELVIVGQVEDQGYAHQLQALITRENLTGHVTFTGLITGEALAATYAHAGVFVLPSRSEGMPVAALEALAAGVPAILSPGCDLPEVASHGAGLVVEASPSALAAAIEQVLANPDEAMHMGSAGRQLARKHFSPARCADSTVAFCQKVLELYRTSSCTFPEVQSDSAGDGLQVTS